jgi:cell division protein FtsQ
MSPEGHRRLVRRALRVGGAAGMLAILGWGAWQTAAAFGDSPGGRPGVADTTPVRNIVLVTDGVLDREWLVHVLALPKGAALMALDLGQLRGRVLASRQVAAASIIRNFPATLQVRMTERAPVARVLVQDGAGAPKVMLVARDGVVYEGAGYDLPLLDSLPWLDGTRLVRAGGCYAPIAGMDSVAELLARAKMEAEPLYREWRVVSLARLASDGEIEVRTLDGTKVIFGTQEDFFRQLARLDLLLDAARARGGDPVREIDLSLGDQVPVSFGPGAREAPPDEAAARVPSYFQAVNQREL